MIGKFFLLGFIAFNFALAYPLLSQDNVNDSAEKSLGIIIQKLSDDETIKPENDLIDPDFLINSETTYDD